jgi:hypothetical protein
VVRGGSPVKPRRAASGFGRRSIEKIVSDAEGMTNTAIHVCAKTVFVFDLQQEVGELVLSITSSHSIISLEAVLNWCIEKMWLW